MKNYFLYARKSSEAEDKQILSIESQQNELENIAAKRELAISEVLQESKSAKAPGRPVFNEMMSRIAQGEARERKNHRVGAGQTNFQVVGAGRQRRESVHTFEGHIAEYDRPATG